MSEIWSPQQANDWYARVSPIVGCNYLPRTAVNSTEMWQAESFDPATIDEELGWAAAAGYNSLRIFVQYLVWLHDPDGLLQRMDRLLAIAAGHGITATFILFDDCAFAGREPYLGVQDDPKPGVHNSGWTPSPGLKLVEDRSVWPQLEAYARAIVGAFSQDERVLLLGPIQRAGQQRPGRAQHPAGGGGLRLGAPGKPAAAADDLGVARQPRVQVPGPHVAGDLHSLGRDFVSLLRAAGPGCDSGAVQVLRPPGHLHRVAAPSLRADGSGGAADLRARAHWLVPVGPSWPAAPRPTWTGAASATARRWVAGSMMCYIPTGGPTTRPRSR